MAPRFRQTIVILGTTVELLTLVCLSACTAPPPSQPVRQYFPHEFLDDDEFAKDATISGGRAVVDNPDGLEEAFYLRTFVNKRTKAFQHQLYVEVYWSGGAIGFDSASDDTSRTLELHRIDRNNPFCPRENCNRYEQFAVDLDDRFLHERASQGFRIKVISRRKGDWIILAVDPLMISAQLAATENFRQTGAVLSPDAIAAIAAKRASQGFGLSTTDFPLVGVLVMKVAPGSLADDAGFVGADIIVSFDGQPVPSVRVFEELVAKTPPGHVVSFEITRHYRQRTLMAQM